MIQYSSHKLLLRGASSNTWQPSKNKEAVLLELIASRLPIRPCFLLPLNPCPWPFAKSIGCLQCFLPGAPRRTVWLENSYATERGQSLGNADYPAAPASGLRLFSWAGTVGKPAAEKKTPFGLVAQISKLATIIGCGCQHQHARSFRLVLSRTGSGYPAVFTGIAGAMRIYTRLNWGKRSVPSVVSEPVEWPRLANVGTL
ncbi:hypothetical protein EDB86DRAFT_2835947 [Lactarius hatsudake]|nr:hypothetical protein EDB86DRAFT_2835947 [Lactarius hatsudake]